MLTVAALYVETDGAYFGLEAVDPWDEERDARLYDGPHAVVAHPPCARWCKLAKFVEYAYPDKTVGEDDGCFESALAAVRLWGGVLEHPAWTLAWPAFGIPCPSRGGWIESLWNRGEWVTEVSQVAYGHAAQKRTWLLYVGPLPPGLDWSEPPHTKVVGSTKRRGGGAMWANPGLGHMSKRERKATPPAFRDALIAMARSTSNEGEKSVR